MASHRIARLTAAGYFAGTCLYLGCPADEDPDQETEASSTSDGPSTTESTSEETSDSSSSSTTDDTTGSTSTTAAATSVTGDITSGGSTGDCPAGSAGCACSGGTCDDGLTCDANLDVCIVAGSCETEVDTEPNDDEAGAQNIGEVECDTVGEVNGSVASGTSDWFTFHGTDEESCDMESIALLTADEELEVCMFFDCDMGEPQVVCPADATEVTSPDGVAGCCGTDQVSFQSQACLGAAETDSGDIWLRVDGSADNACVDYALAYRFF